jgi:hypothetical protein
MFSIVKANNIITYREGNDISKTGKGVLHEAIHTITNRALCSSLTFLKNWNSEMQISGTLPHRISTKSLTRFMIYMEKSIYGLTYIRLSYGVSRLKIGNAEQFLVEVSHIEFLDKLSNCLRPDNRSEMDRHVLKT